MDNSGVTKSDIKINGENFLTGTLATYSLQQKVLVRLQMPSILTPVYMVQLQQPLTE